MSDSLLEKLLKLPEFEITDIHQNDYDIGIYVETKNVQKFALFVVYILPN